MNNRSTSQLEKKPSARRKKRDEGLSAVSGTLSKYRSQRKHFVATWDFQVYKADPAIYPSDVSANHPAKAPHYLMERIFQFLENDLRVLFPGDRVLDLFGGRGTTGVVSAMFGHPCTLVEIEPQFTETVIPTVLSFAKSKIRDYWKADVDVVLGDARQTGLASASFDVMITSPPYADKIHRKSTTATLRALGKRGHEPSVSAIIDGYKFSSSKNIGLLGVHKKRKANQTYAQAMEDVYRETFRLLKPGGIAAVITKDMVRDGKRIRIGVINKKAALTAGLELVCVRFGEVARPVYGDANLFGEIEDPKLIGRNNFFQRFHLKRDPLSNIRFEHIFFFRRPVHTTPQPHDPTNLPDTIQPTTLIASDTPQMTPDTTTNQITLTQGHVSHSDESLWESMPGLVWSNPKASDAAHIAAALLNPRFLQLLAIAQHFGTARLQKAWATLLEESPEEAKRAAPQTERILANILEGEHLAHAGN